MLDRYKFTGSDAFFLTFIAAWCSTSKELWGNPKFAIALILFTLLCSIFIAQLRFTWNEKNKGIFKETYISLIIFAALTVYISYNINKVLSINDIIFLASIFVIWIVYAYYSYAVFNKIVIETDLNSMK